MADIEYTIEGMDELRDKASRVSGDLGSVVRKLLNDSVAGIEGKAKKLAPVDTGKLRSSITHKVDSARIPLWSEAGTNVLYARPVEFGSKPHWAPFRAFETWARRHHMNEADVWWAVGTKGTKAHPFLTPAFEDSQSDIEANLNEAKRTIEGMWD